MKRELKVFSTEVIPVYETDTGEKVVIGRELHEKLHIKDHYKDWFPRMVEYGFFEKVDFTSFAEKSAKLSGGRPRVDHILKLDIAKHLAMIQRTNERTSRI